MSLEDGIRFFGRHFVNLCWIDETAGVRAEANSGHGTPFTTSGFIISVRGIWLLVTAGHILSDLEDAKAKGQRLTNLALDDTWSPTARHPNMFFDFDGAPKHHVYNKENGEDYGVICLRNNVCDLLKANGAEAIDELAWKVALPGDFDRYFLLGTPDELIDVDTVGGLHVKRPLVMFEVERTDSPPECLATFPRIYYRMSKHIVDANTRADELTDIDGMSGCPLIGLKQMPDRTLRYWIIGVQSGWYRTSRIGYACPLKTLGEWIEAGLARQIQGEEQ